MNLLYLCITAKNSTLERKAWLRTIGRDLQNDWYNGNNSLEEKTKPTNFNTATLSRDENHHIKNIKSALSQR